MQHETVTRIKIKVKKSNENKIYRNDLFFFYPRKNKSRAKGVILFDSFGDVIWCTVFEFY